MSVDQRLGLICSSPDHLVCLEKLASTCGYRVVIAAIANEMDIRALPEVDAWVMHVEFDETTLALYEALDDMQIPVIFDEGMHFTEGENEKLLCRRFINKVHECMGRQITAQTPELEQICDLDRENQGSIQCEPAKKIWVLGASTGGPEAIKRFLSTLDNAPDDTAFIYVQHIDFNMHQSLLTMLRKHTVLKIENTVTSKRLLSRHLYLVNPDEEVDITQAGVIVPTSKPWTGFYKPSINQVMAKVARNYAHSCGAIIFSGMGNDGADSAQFFKTYGGCVMVQSPITCTIDSMPISTLDRISVFYEGSPEQLAKKLMQIGHNTL